MFAVWCRYGRREKVQSRSNDQNQEDVDALLQKLRKRGVEGAEGTENERYNATCEPGMYAYMYAPQHARVLLA
jgi:hypothetical protein